MKNFILSLVFMLGVFSVSNAEQNMTQLASASANCDQEALETYEEVYAETGNSNAATSASSSDYWDCINDGGMSDQTVILN